MSTSMRVKKSTLHALTLVAPPGTSPPPSTWKLMETNGHRRRRKTAPTDGALDVGTILRTTRRRRRISMDRATAETCIPRRYLEALERNLPASAFPGALYARGFLRAYARYLGIADENALLARFGGDEPAPIEILEDAVPPPEVRRKRIRIILLGVVLLGAVAGIATTGSSHPVKTAFPAPFPMIAAPPSTETKVPSESSTTPPASAPSAPEITIEVMRGRSWLRVVADGTAIERGHIVGPSFTERFAAKRSLQIIVGNAGVVRVLYEGTWRSVGPAGHVVKMTITMSNGVPVLRVIG
jgi:Helix-turn-helix domain